MLPNSYKLIEEHVRNRRVGKILREAVVNLKKYPWSSVGLFAYYKGEFSIDARGAVALCHPKIKSLLAIGNFDILQLAKVFNDDMFKTCARTCPLRRAHDIAMMYNSTHKDASHMLNLMADIWRNEYK